MTVEYLRNKNFNISIKIWISILKIILINTRPKFFFFHPLESLFQKYIYYRILLLLIRKVNKKKLFRFFEIY